MTVLPILLAPDPRLKAVARKVAVIDERIRRLVADMLETMYQAPGIGLAAPQVGVGLRLFVADLADKGAGRAPIVAINPEIVWRSDELASAEEGCLSLPEHYGEVTRPARITLAFQDLEGRAQRLDAEGLLARCLQHELDHLDGILFVDHLSALKRGIILRKLAKARRLKASG